MVQPSYRISKIHYRSTSSKNNNAVIISMIHNNLFCVAALGFGEAADEEAWEVVLLWIWTLHQQQVLHAQISMRDAVCFQMLQTRAQLQQQKTHAPLVNLRLRAVERLPLADEIRHALVRDVPGDHHHSLLLGRTALLAG